MDRDAADLVLEFVNTRPNGNGQPEQFADAESVQAWLVGHGLLGAGERGRDPVTPADADAARELRELLATVLRAHVDLAEPEELAAAEQHLQRIAMRHPLVPQVRADGVRLVAAQDGVPGAFATVLAAVAEIDADGRWQRVKMCANPPCHAGFLDRTRNCAGRYCSSACGSQIAMRAYRSRLKSR